VREGLARGKAEAIALLQSILRGFEEELGDLGENDAGHALRAIEGLDLHAAIDGAAGALYRNGHNAEAVRNACMALNNLVQIASDRYDLDGTDLMQNVFSANDPILKFNDGNDETDASEQRGMMYLYAGAMLALRNPRSHKFVEYDAERAVESIAFISLLAKLLDETERAKAKRQKEKPRRSGAVSRA
jgi:uncharacterized protein (TIGR02391 family)